MKQLHCFLLIISLHTGFLHAQTWISLNRLMNTAVRSGNYEEAVQYGEKALEQVRSQYGNKHLFFASIANNLGEAYYQKGLYAQAEKLFLESYRIRKQQLGISNKDYAVSLNNLGVLYMTTESYKKAEPYCIESLQINESILGKSHPSYTMSLNNLAYLYQLMGKYEKSEKLYQEVIEIDEKIIGVYSAEYTQDLNNLAVLYGYMGFFEQAEKLYQKSMKIRARIMGKNHPEYAKSLNNLALLYKILGKHTEAELLYQESLKIWNEKVNGNQHPELARTLNNLAGVYENIGAFEKAENLYLQSLEIKDKVYGKNSYANINSLHNLGFLYMMVGLYDQAKSYLEESLQITSKIVGEDHPLYATILNSMAGLYENLNQPKQAEVAYQKSLIIRKKVLGKEHPDYAISLNNLAGFYNERDSFSKAEHYYFQALQLLEKSVGKDHPNYATCLKNIAMLYDDMNDVKKADLFNKNSIKSYLNLIKKYYPGLNESEKIIYIKNKIDYAFNISNSFAYRNLNLYTELIPTVINTDLYVKGLVLSTTSNIRNSILQSGDTSLQKLYDKYLSRRRQLSQGLSYSITERENRNISIDQLERQVDSLGKILSRRSQIFANQFENTRYQWQDIQSQLKTNEVGISFLDFRYFSGQEWTDTTYYIAFVIRSKDEYPQFIKLCRKKDLLNFLNHSNPNNQDTYISDIEIADELYQLLWKPLLPYLGKNSTIHYSPSGLLNRISFQALPDKKGNRLNDIYQLNQYTTLRDFIKQRNQHKKISTNTIATFGGANFNLSIAPSINTPTDSLSLINSHPSLPKHRGKVMESWPYLEGTKKEVERINQLSNQSGWKAENYADTIATEQNFKKLSGNSPRILHIATHGFFLPDPTTDIEELNRLQLMRDSYQKSISLSEQPLMRSGLLFTGANHTWKGEEVPEGVDDGILTSYEIVNLDLRNTELVVLSACDTGLGDIESTEGVFGLQRAFKQAGVDKIIMSLWKVPDNETVDFMETFYGYYLNGDTIRDAFIKTQREMAEKYEPYYWAGFVLVE